MADNLWRWHRRQAVVAISLLGAAFASAQEQPQTEVPAQTPGVDAPQAKTPTVNKTALRDLRAAALSGSGKIAVDWRFVSDGKSIKEAPERAAPEFILSGARAGDASIQSYAEQDVEKIIIVLLSGRSAAELGYMRETSAAALAALPDGAYRVLIGTGGDDFAWAADKQVKNASEISAMFSQDAVKGAAPSVNTKTLTTGYAAALEALKSASPRARAAIVVPEPLLPQNQDLLTRLGQAAFEQRISFFPVAPKGGVSASRAQSMIDFAGPGAGRFLPDALDGRPVEARRPMFTEFLSGASHVFTLNAKDMYVLPFEDSRPAVLTVNYGDLSDSLNLNIERVPLRGAALAGAIVNPAHWTSWLATPGRRVWGLGSLLLWLAALALILRLIFPPVKVFAQIAGDDKIQKIRRLPAQIGRSGESQIHLDHEGVSRAHAVIETHDDGLVLKDLGSTNGTFMAGDRLKSALLRSVQTVQFGPVKVILRTKR